MVDGSRVTKKQLAELDGIERYAATGGLVTIQVWRTEDGWSYDGPASTGPKEVRTSGRGPCWKGPVDAKHAAELLVRLRAAGGYTVTVTPREAAAASPVEDLKADLFKAWFAEVDKLCLAKFMMGLSDLPDMMTRDAFDAGTTPKEFFDDEVMRVMREDFGELVDEV